MNHYGNQMIALIEELSRLPGIGAKSAQRLAFHIISMPKENVDRLANAIVVAKDQIKYCKSCWTVTDKELCHICRDDSRNRKEIMIVEDSRDMAAYEKTKEFKGVYHVLHGLISPLDNIGPDAICIQELTERLKGGEIKEAILATGATTEGEATAIYIANKILKPLGIKVTRLSYGIPIGSNLEYADEMTLCRALKDRNEF